MHRYQCIQTPPLLQLTIDLWKTTTLTEFHIWKTAQTPVQTDPTPPPIDHRSLEVHYNSADRSHPSSNSPYTCRMHYYTSADRLHHPLLQLTIDLWKTTKLTKFHI